MENFAAVTFSEEETVNAVPTHLKSMTVRNSHLYYLTPHLNGQWCGHVTPHNLACSTAYSNPWLMQSMWKASVKNGFDM